LMPDSVYGPARALCDGLLARMGVETTFYDPLIGAGITSLVRTQTRVVYLESPGSYTMEIQDIPAICHAIGELAADQGLPVVRILDNTWASPVLARPFDWGVDVSVVALTKYWGGHADLLMGAVVCRDEHWTEVFDVCRQMGLCVGGDDAWLVLRGMRTLDLRFRQHEAAGVEVASWLQSRPEVARVLHPAFESHPQHALWKRDFSGANGLFSFELKPEAVPAGRPLAQALGPLCDYRRHFGIGYSWGGFESLIMPARFTRTVAGWKGGPLVRLHVGLEDPKALIADLEEGFEALSRSVRATP
ncbi:MAG: PLP-dependent transferase, partial [Burkholderiales bacterium]